MDWLFNNKIAPTEIPKIVTDLNQNDDLEELFLQNENEVFSEVEFKRVWDKSADLLIRSRIYALLDAPSGDFDAVIANTQESLSDYRIYLEDVTEDYVLNSLSYNQGDGSPTFPYDLCLEYLAKSKLKFVNTMSINKHTVNSQCPGRKRHPRKIPATRRPLLSRLYSLTKQVQFLRRRNLGNAHLNENAFTSSISSSADDIMSFPSSVGDYETENKSRSLTYRRNKLKRKRKWKVRYQNYYNSRRQHLLQLERGSKKSRRRKAGNKSHLWPLHCCSEKPQLGSNAHVRDILRYSVQALFLFICVRILLDGLQHNEHFED